MPTTLSDISILLNVPCPPGAANRAITGVAMVADASPTELSFVGADKYAPQLTTTRARPPKLASVMSKLLPM
jgi:UDP-3-O-[3-hydroxymyristoyl] glucosamine N-acyltransferase